jgi:voltage-gated potassium channel
VKETQPSANFRQRAWEILEAVRPGDLPSRIFHGFILLLIAINVAAVIVGSVRSVQASHGRLLEFIEVFSVAIFTIEYLVRLWTCVSQPEYAAPLTGRLKFAVRPLPVIDLLAILPFYLEFLPLDLRVVRALRLFRLFRIAKLGRYSKTIRLFARVFTTRKEELVISASVMVVLIILSSSFIYFAENQAQPDKFPDIPSAMWWSVVTLTTVGYGDVYPVTPLGKFLAAVIAMLGIGMFALPAGILGASFVEEIEKQKAGTPCCPHCGKEIN